VPDITFAAGDGGDGSSNDGSTEAAPLWCHDSGAPSGSECCLNGAGPCVGTNGVACDVSECNACAGMMCDTVKPVCCAKNAVMLKCIEATLACQ
jgi:hypothetical protein